MVAVAVRTCEVIDIFEAAGRRITNCRAQPLDVCIRLAAQALGTFTGSDTHTQYLIEQQPMRLGGAGGSRMKALSMGIYGWFLGKTTHPTGFYHAKHKQNVGRLIPEVLPPDTRTLLERWAGTKVYAERKSLGVQCVRALCEAGVVCGNEQSQACLSSAKADDAADAISQGLHWLLSRKRGAPRRVVSIDIGMRNLAVAVLEECDSDGAAEGAQ